MPPAEPRILFTCEHGGNRIPKEFDALFAGKTRRLASHRGWDPGALQMARSLARSLQAPLVSATTSRLLIDLNRSPGNPRVFSRTTAALSKSQRDAIRSRYHEPHWDRIRERIGTDSVMTIHIAVHSFTPSLNGKRRPYAIGLLYDPKRRNEARLASIWQSILREQLGRDEVRRNAPYRGASDGLTTALRRTNAPQRYVGIELELNQARIASAQARRALGRILSGSLRCAVHECFSG